MSRPYSALLAERGSPSSVSISRLCGNWSCRNVNNCIIATNPEVEAFTMGVAMDEKDVLDIASWLGNHSEAIAGRGNDS